MRCVGQSTTADQHSTIRDSAITRPRVIADSQVGSASAAKAGAHLTYEYRRVRGVEPAAPRRRLARPRRRTGVRFACQRRRSTRWAALLAVVTTTASPIVMPKKVATKATLINSFIGHPSPGHHRDRRVSVTLPIKRLPNHHRVARPLDLRSIL